MGEDSGEFSKGGSKIYRHAAASDEWAPPADLDAEHSMAIEAHLATHVGAVSHVFHEIMSDRVHLDVHVIPPGPNRDYSVLFTTGMSALPMTMPTGVETSAFAELAVLLPPTWKLDEASWNDEAWYWPIRLLKFLARLPHDYSTWLGHGHTIPNGDPAGPFAANTRLAGAVILPSLSLSPEAQRIPIPGARVVDLWTVWPLHADEMDLKLRDGVDALLDAFERDGVRDVIDPKRPSVVRPKPRKKLFGLF